MVVEQMSSGRIFDDEQDDIAVCLPIRTSDEKLEMIVAACVH